jgi:hypothetical protein
VLWLTNTCCSNNDISFVYAVFVVERPEFIIHMVTDKHVVCLIKDISLLNYSWENNCKGLQS